MATLSGRVAGRGRTWVVRRRAAASDSARCAFWPRARPRLPSRPHAAARASRAAGRRAPNHLGTPARVALGETRDVPPIRGSRPAQPTRSHPSCSRTTPVTVPTGMPLGYTPPSLEESTRCRSVPSRGRARRETRGHLAGTRRGRCHDTGGVAGDGERAHPELRVSPGHHDAGTPRRSE